MLLVQRTVARFTEQIRSLTTKNLCQLHQPRHRRHDDAALDARHRFIANPQPLGHLILSQIHRLAMASNAFAYPLRQRLHIRFRHYALQVNLDS